MNNFNNQYGYSDQAINPMQQNNFRNNIQLKQYANVNGINDAKAYRLMPNTTMMLMDYDNPILYKKSVDMNGNTSIRYFKFEEIDEETALSLTQPVQQPQNNYASKDDIDNINKRLDELFKRLDKNITKKEQKDISNT